MQLNIENYKKELRGISVVEVSGEGCANCITLMPILYKILSLRDDCVLHHLEVNEQNMALCKEFSIDRVPTILVLKDREVMARCTGYQPEEILEIWLDTKINEIKNNV